MTSPRRKLAGSSCTANMRGLRNSVALAASLGILASATAAQDAAVELTPDQFFAVGVTALRSGDAAQAARVADALLTRNQSEYAALMLRTEAAVAVKDFAAAAKFGARAYAAASLDQQRFLAAKVTAVAQAELGRLSRAQIWLRRARQFAPNESEANIVAKDYQFLRDRNPWSTQLRFGAQPTTNINNGSASETTRLFNTPGAVLNGQARALSGIEFTLGADLTYRLAAAQTHATFATVSADLRSYRMSDAAIEQAPNAKGSDFSDAHLVFGLLHRQKFAALPRATNFRLSAGQTWYGGEAHSRFAQLNVDQDWPIGDSSTFGLNLNLRRQISLEEDAPGATPNPRFNPVNAYAITASWTEKFKNDAQFTVSASKTRSASQFVGADYDGKRLSLDYNLAQSYQGMKFGFGYDAEIRDYAEGTYNKGPRNDRTNTMRMSVVLTDIEFYGFQPVIDLRSSSTESSTELFSRDYTSLGFDLRSSF